MKTSDRRSGHDRRSHDRRAVSIDVEWESNEVRRTGTISDLSEAGCFVLCSGEVDRGDTVKLFLPIGEGMKVQVLGEVRDKALEIGFSVRFIETTQAQRDLILGLMEKYSEPG